MENIKIKEINTNIAVESVTGIGLTCRAVVTFNILIGE